MVGSLFGMFWCIVVVRVWLGHGLHGLNVVCGLMVHGRLG